jgi:simple sugar transport system ATP-binding protein
MNSNILSEDPKELIKLVGIHKYFGKVHALKGVELKINRAECVGLVGDNGAGKSTLIKIISGYHKPDKGKIYFKGVGEVKISTPVDARKLGIETVYQEQALAPTLNISRNIFMGRELTGKFGFLREKEMGKKSMQVLKTIGLNIASHDISISDLSGGQRQGIAIARALYFEARLVILDEPTIALSVKEVKQVLDFINDLKRKGVAIILIAHNLYHIFSVADRVVIMSHGEKITDINAKDTDVISLTDFIIKHS